MRPLLKCAAAPVIRSNIADAGARSCHARDCARYRDHRSRSVWTATVWSRSAASSWSIAYRPDKTFHAYFNPQRSMPAEAFAVHGLSEEFLKDKAFFAEMADDLVAFLGDAPLVIHNAAFDLGFLNAELERAGKSLIARERWSIRS